MRGLLWLCVGMVVVAEWANAGTSYDTMRCGNKLISLGDSADKLAAACGAPTTEDEYEEESGYYFDTPKFHDQNRSHGEHRKGFQVRKLVKIKLWTYNNGPNRFIEYVRIENGRIVKIENGGYGY